MKPAKNRRLRPFRSCALETLEDRYLLSGAQFELAWGPTVVGTGSGSAYYLNDTVVNGNVIGARLTYGPYEQDKTGAIVHALQTTTGSFGSKSAAQVGDYVYFTGDNGGVYRTQVANTALPWTSYAACTFSGATGATKPLETLATDGTLLYASSTAENDQVHAYSVDPDTGTLTLVWSTTGIAGRVRGLDWDARGYIYAADGGGPLENVANNTANLYAIAAATGVVTPMGQITFNGRQYGTIREGNQLLVFDSCTLGTVPAGQIYVYDLATDTSLVSTTPVNTWDPAGIGRIFGAAIDSGTMWLTSVSGQTYGYSVVSLDADGNGTAAALSDGILMLRYLFDPAGAWNVDDALGSGATRTTREEIKTYLDGGDTTMLDADGNGTAAALSDGILMLRYLFDPAGAWNVDDALGSGATRTTREEIKAYLDLYNSGAVIGGSLAAAESLGDTGGLDDTGSTAIVASSDATSPTGAGVTLIADFAPALLAKDNIDGAQETDLLVGADAETQSLASQSLAGSDDFPAMPTEVLAVDAILQQWNRPVTSEEESPEPDSCIDPSPLSGDSLPGA